MTAYERYVADQIAEVTRLRAALDRIAKYAEDGQSGAPIHAYGMLRKIRMSAKRAMNRKKRP